MRSFTVVLLLFMFSICESQGLSQTCGIKVSPGKPDTEFDRIFTQNGPGQGLEPVTGPGWVGADSAYSLLLPNGNSAFFFSDSYIAEYPPKKGDGTVTTGANGVRRRLANCGPPICVPPVNIFSAHNSVVIRDRLTGKLKTLTGPKNSEGFSLSYFTPPAGTPNTHFYWVGDSVVINIGNRSKVWTFVMEFDAKFTYYGSAIAQLSLPDLGIESLVRLKGTKGSTVAWGSSLVLEQSQEISSLFIYGIQNQQKINGKVPYIARVDPSLGLDGVANAENWSVWSGNNWVSGLTNAVQLLGAANDANNAGDQISDEYSVKKIRVGRRNVFVLIGMDTTVPFGKWKDITLYTACNPQGPFSARQVVYSMPESEAVKVPGMGGSQSLAGPLVVYSPHLHPQFTDKRGLLISYDMNTTKGEDLLFADAYRPRFIRVPVEGLQ